MGINDYSPDWTAIEKMHERMLRGETAAAALAYAKAHHALRAWLGVFVTHLRYCTVYESYMCPVDETLLDDALGHVVRYELQRYFDTQPKPPKVRPTLGDKATRLVLRAYDRLQLRLHRGRA